MVHLKEKVHKCKGENWQHQVYPNIQLHTIILAIEF